MHPVTISQIVEQLNHLSAEQLASVFELVSQMAAQDEEAGSLHTMIASEALLGRDWDRPEEDAAWQNL